MVQNASECFVNHSFWSFILGGCKEGGGVKEWRTVRFAKLTIKEFYQGESLGLRVIFLRKCDNPTSPNIRYWMSQNDLILRLTVLLYPVNSLFDKKQAVTSEINKNFFLQINKKS